MEFFRNHEGPITISATGGGKGCDLTIKVTGKRIAHDIALVLQDHLNRLTRKNDNDDVQRRF